MLGTAKALYKLNGEYTLTPVGPHDGGRNVIYLCKYSGDAAFCGTESRNQDSMDKDSGDPKYGDPERVLRISMTGDRTEADYLAETAFVHFLAQNGASVADVIPSVNGRLVERVPVGDREAFVSCFEYARGMLISDNGYRYREGHPLTEYFYNTGKTLGRIHKLSKQYGADCHRQDYFEKYNLTYIDELLADEMHADELHSDEMHADELCPDDLHADELRSDKM